MNRLGTALWGYKLQFCKQIASIFWIKSILFRKMCWHINKGILLPSVPILTIFTERENQMDIADYNENPIIFRFLFRTIFKFMNTGMICKVSGLHFWPSFLAELKCRSRQKIQKIWMKTCIHLYNRYEDLGSELFNSTFKPKINVCVVVQHWQGSWREADLSSLLPGESGGSLRSCLHHSLSDHRCGSQPYASQEARWGSFSLLLLDVHYSLFMISIS